MNDSNDLLVRMNRLERQHRRLRLFFTGALVLLGVALISGQAGPQAKPKQAEPLRRVEAQQFVLVDAHGVEWGRWSALGEIGTFSLGKETSKSKITMHASKNVAGIIVTHQDLVGTLGAAGGGMHVRVRCKGGPALNLSAFDNRIGLELKDNKGILRGRWGVVNDGHSFLTLHDKSGQTRTELAILSDGYTSIRFYDKSGTLRTSLGNTELEVTKTGEGRMLAESSLVLFDKDSKVLFKAP